MNFKETYLQIFDYLKTNLPSYLGTLDPIKKFTFGFSDMVKDAQFPALVLAPDRGELDPETTGYDRSKDKFFLFIGLNKGGAENGLGYLDALSTFLKENESFGSPYIVGTDLLNYDIGIPTDGSPLSVLSLELEIQIQH